MTLCGAVRDNRPREVDRRDDAERRERPPGRLDVEVDPADEPRDGERADADRGEREKRRLRERCQVLRLPVAVEVSRVCRSRRDADCKQRQERGDEVRAGVRRVREKPEAASGEPRDELDRDEADRGDDRRERGAAKR